MKELEENLFKECVENVYKRNISYPHSRVQEELSRYLIKKYLSNINKIKCEYEVKTINEKGNNINWFLDLYLETDNGKKYFVEIKTRYDYYDEEFFRRKIWKIVNSNEFKSGKDNVVVFCLPNKFNKEIIYEIERFLNEYKVKTNVGLILYDMKEDGFVWTLYLQE
ncbi:MAG: hypothetical protein RMJ17_04250 [Candidatus Aenigmarchaeota archaeon]|nr:hypothetical protein [Candidatus Aenigmarchaeota archaeon]MDW8149769.1 hypothetical protein [Candidatus Aenigmarchaeota archaeon]